MGLSNKPKKEWIKNPCGDGNRFVRLVVVSLLALLLVPLLLMLGMMTCGGSMMAQMSGQMGGMMSAALVFLIVLVVRGGPIRLEGSARTNISSPLPYQGR